MTTIIVTFICDFTKNLDEVNENGKKGKGKTGKRKKEKEVKIIEDKKEETEKKDEELAVVVNVKKPIKYLHIEYNLLPGKFLYKIDVVFWGTIAKIYTQDGMKAMKSINQDGHYWIAFSIKHKVVLDENDLVKLKSHAANFSITTSKKKIVSSLAKKDANKTFYFKEEAIELKSKFAEAFEIDPNEKKSDDTEDVDIDLKTRNINDIKYILNDLLNFPTKNEPQSEFYVIPDELHQTRALKIIEKISANKKINCLNSLEDSLDVNELLAVKKKGKGKGGKDKKTKKDKKPKKDKIGKPKKNDASQIVIPGESYFTNPGMTLFDLKLSNEDLSNSFVCIDVQRLMNAEQKLELNPLIIKVHKIINIPEDILLEHGFSYVYVSYNICNIDHKTGARPISNQIHFEDHHIYFIEKPYLNNLAECIANKFLVVQMHGIRIKPQEKPSEIFGENINDEFISNPVQNQYEVLQHNEGDKEMNKKSVLLAISRIKLNELLKPFWRTVRIEPCIHPKYNNYLHENQDELKITMNTLSIDNSNIFDQNPLTDNILLTSGLSIKVGVQLINPIVYVLDDMIESYQSINRIFLIMHHLNTAKSFLFNVFVHNSHWMQKKHIAPNYLCKLEDLPDKNHARNVITGFCIGCGDHCIMFLEGTRRWIYQLFWSVIRREKKQLVKVIFNSNYVYEKRLYTNLMLFGGVYFISLQYSLHYLLNDRRTFIKGYMPEPCRRALLKLDLLKKSSLNDDIPDNLLPTIKELLSLSAEWGVPRHWPLKK